VQQVTWNEDPTKAPKDEGMTLTGAINALQAKGACLMEKVGKILQAFQNPDCTDKHESRVTDNWVLLNAMGSGPLSSNMSTRSQMPSALTRLSTTKYRLPSR
jgi:hypothetical protein